MKVLYRNQNIQYIRNMKQYEILKNSYVFLGVSICSRTYSGQTLSNIFDWCERHCKGAYILVADEPQAYTFMASKGLEYQAALTKAQEIGAIKIKFIQKIIDKHKYKNIHIMKWSDIKSTSIYMKTLDSLQNLYHGNTNFKRDVISQIKKRNSTLPKEFYTEIIDSTVFDIAASYILSEISAIIYFHKYFKPICHYQISPFPITRLLLNIYNNKYSSDSNILITHVRYIELLSEALEDLLPNYLYSDKNRNIDSYRGVKFFQCSTLIMEEGQKYVIKD